jgi:hypothetical protein
MKGSLIMITTNSYINYLKERILECDGIIEERIRQLELEEDLFVKEFILESINDWKSYKENYLINLESIKLRIQ